jgi:hypothetical protein
METLKLLIGIPLAVLDFIVFDIIFTPYILVLVAGTLLWYNI